MTDDTRVNGDIDAEFVQLVGVDGTDFGVKVLSEARAIAREQRLDLVEVAANADPPVCRLMDLASWKREANMRRGARHQKAVGVAVNVTRFIGLNEDVARERVEAAGLIWRVVKRDGVGIEHRADIRYDRISAEITNGIVTDATVA